MVFLSDMMSSTCDFIRSVAALSANEELNTIATFYNVDVPCLVRNYHVITLKCVEALVGL